MLKMIGVFVAVLAICAEVYSSCPKIISRSEWGGRSPIAVEYSIIPLDYVIIHHTVTPTCSSLSTCSSLITNMQTFHMEELDFHDIGYNFLIDSEGNIYEGVGWHKVGAHTRGYNTKSIGIAFIGNFVERTPPRAQIEAAKKLLVCGVETGELQRRYKLLGGRQVSKTESPGLMLYREIQRWSNYQRNP